MAKTFTVFSQTPTEITNSESVLVATRTSDFLLNTTTADVPSNIPIDGDVNGALDDVQMIANGLITFNKKALYGITHTLIVGRDSVTASSRVHVLILLNGLPFPNTASTPPLNEEAATLLIAEYSGADEFSGVISGSSFINANAGDTHRIQIYTDGAGGLNNQVKLYAAPNTRLGNNDFSYRVRVVKVSQ